MHCKDAVYVVVTTAEHRMHMLIKQPCGVPPDRVAQADTVLSPFASNLASEEHDIISLSAIKPAQVCKLLFLLMHICPNLSLL